METELCRPSANLVGETAQWQGDLVILGAGGKIGSGVAVMARRALDAAKVNSRVIAVSRWKDAQAKTRLEDKGITTISADLSDTKDLEKLPKASQVIYLVGAKFGTSTNSDEAWMTNTVTAAMVAERFPGARISALSTGNVYPMTKASTGGSTEEDELGPIGEYAITCLGRERVLTYASRTRGTRIAIIRLNYACEPRYGVIADIGKRILASEAIDISSASVNVVWQRYVNEVILRSLRHASTPPFLLNLAGPETASVRRIAELLGDRLGIKPVFSGSESDTSLLNNAGKCHALFGYPDRSLVQLIDLQAGWLTAGGKTWNKPTKFERRDGMF